MGTEENNNRIGGLRFSVYKNDELERTVVLAQDCVFIGRLLTSHLPIEDPKVSRMHAVVEVRDGKDVILTDLESSNGTRVNGQIERTIDLKTGDVIDIGDSQIKLEILSGEQIAEMPSVIYHSSISRGLAQQTRVDTVMLDSQKLDSVSVSSEDIDTVLGEIKPDDAKPKKKSKKFASQAVTKVEDTHVIDKKKTPAPAKADVSEVLDSSTPSAKVTEASSEEAPQLPGEPTSVPLTQDIPKPTPVRSRMGTALELKIQWGEEILDVLHLDEPETITAGKDKKNTFIIPPMQAFPGSVPIVSPVSEKKGAGSMLGFTENMEGWVFAGDRLQSLDDLKESSRTRSVDLDGKRVYLYPLSPSDKGVLSIENLAFCFQTVRAFPPYKSPPNKVDRRPFWIGLALYAAISALIYFIPVPESELTVEEQVEETAKSAELVYSRERVQGFLDQLVSQELQTGSVGGSIKGRVQTGKSGKTRETKTGGQSGKRGRAKGPVRKVPSQQPGGRDVAKVLDSLKADDLTRILGNDGLTGGGGGIGASAGSNANVKSAPRVFANIGGAIKGSGAKGDGGGGVGYGGGDSVDVGGLGTKGRGGGSGGYGAVRLGKKLEVAIDYSDEDDILVRGALDRALVQRVIQRNMGQIKLCYDARLQFSGNRKLSGRVQMGWRIGANGLVSRVRTMQSSVNDATFEQCIADRIKTWVFPQPKGGGSVRVDYPFVFRPVG